MQKTDDTTSRSRAVRPTDEEEAEIQRGIAQDPDNPEWTDEQFKQARRNRGHDTAISKQIIRAEMAGDLFDEGWQTWTPSQAKSMFMAGLVDDFFCTRVQDHWCLIFMVAGGKDKEQFFALRGAREPDKRKYRRFKSLDAAVNAASEVGFDCRSIGQHVVKALVEREAARRLARLGGSQLDFKAAPRRRRDG